MYLERAGGNVLPESSKDSSVVGYKAIAFRHGWRDWSIGEAIRQADDEKVMAPAIKLARDGFSLAYDDAQDFKEDEHLAQFS